MQKNRSDAKDANDKYYFTGKVCKNGHIAKRATVDCHCVVCVKEYVDKNRIEILRKQRVYYKDNFKAIMETKSRYKALNKDKIRKYTREYNPIKNDRVKYRHANEPMFRLSRNVRGAIHNSLKSKETYGAIRYLEYTIDELKTHLERQFTSGMTWGNYGKWHIDHILPISSFAIKNSKCSEFKACWSLTNLMPLWARDNISKGGKILHLI